MQAEGEIRHWTQENKRLEAELSSLRRDKARYRAKLLSAALAFLSGEAVYCVEGGSAFKIAEVLGYDGPLRKDYLGEWLHTELNRLSEADADFSLSEKDLSLDNTGDGERDSRLHPQTGDILGWESPHESIESTVGRVGSGFGAIIELKTHTRRTAMPLAEWPSYARNAVIVHAAD